MALFTALALLLFPRITQAAQSFMPGLAVEWGGGNSVVPGTNPDIANGYPLDLGDRFGRSSAALVDLDGDGVPDVAVSSSRDSDGKYGAGAIYILFLDRQGQVTRSQKISTFYGGFASAPNGAGQALPSLIEQDRFGYSLACLGDVDGDGVVDLLVGADGDDDSEGNVLSITSQPGPGAVYILFLNKNGTVKHRQKISNSHGGLAENLIGCSGCVPLADMDGFGQSAAALGDYDGDGIPDAMVGAPNAGSGGTLFMLLLHADGTVKAASRISSVLGGFASAAGTGTIHNSDAFSGRGLALLGDLDGDSKNEIVVGSYGADGSGAVWILWLNLDESLGFQVTRKQKISSDGTGFPPHFTFEITADSTGFQMNTGGAQFGHSLASLGDIDGDGIPDLAVSANNLGSGALYMLTLTSTGTVKNGMKIDPSIGGAFAGLASLPSGDRFGRSLSALGDVRGDGGFTLVSGAEGGASKTGDVWLLAFNPNPCAASETNACQVYPAGLPFLLSSSKSSTFTSSISTTTEASSTSVSTSKAFLEPSTTEVPRGYSQLYSTSSSLVLSRLVICGLLMLSASIV
jgi:hypothetical protein